MAWRDSRRSRARLLLFMSSIVLGVAALVGINSFGDNLAAAIRGQARELLGADLVVSAPQPFEPNMLPILAKLGREQAEEQAFASLVQFPKSQNVRLAQVRGITGAFPFYGAWEVQPAGAVAEFRAGRGALVDENLLIQFNVHLGDTVRVGRLALPVLGRVVKTPGQTGLASAVAPAVFIPGSQVAATGLVQRGSRVQYRRYVRFAPGTDVAAILKPLQARLDQANLDTDTVASRQQATGRAFENLTRYLALVALVALLLGGVGVASAVGVYVRDKLADVAVLRCLGASGRQAMLIYLIQTAGLGLLGAALGTALGVGVQALLPRVLGSFLPVSVEVTPSWPAILTGLGAGLGLAVLFALRPLLAVRRVAPLRVLRQDFEADTAAPDPWRGAVLALLAAAVLAFAYWQTRDWKLALGFGLGLAVAVAALAGLAWGLTRAVRRLLPAGASYAVRQGLANLYRPHNQTLTLLTSLGLGTFLLATLALTQGLLLGRIQGAARGEQPNLILFDIQPEQHAGVETLLRGQGLPVVQRLPIVTMRLAAINGEKTSAIRKDTARGIPAWVLTREYRVTYRDTLSPSEKLASGTLPQRGAGGGLPRVSVDANYAKTAHLKLGDTLIFNVQGAPLEVVVGGTRTVDWARVQTNFLVVFPTGVLEQAPQFNVILTRTGSPAALARVQQALVRDFPNVSAIDLGLILRTVDDILGQIALVVRFMAGFSIATGLLVLASAVAVSRYQRLRESVLLRTLGASRGLILRITVVEYAVLGLLAALSGAGLALGAAAVLAATVFEADFAPAAGPLLGLVAGVTALTALIGVLNSRAALLRPPLEVLRGAG